MGHRRVAATLLIVVLAGCSTDTTSTTASSTSRCTGPPATELTPASDYTLAISTTVAAPGTVIDVEMQFPTAPPEFATRGITEMWQCWDGTQWIDTHQLMTTGGPDNGPVALELRSDPPSTVPPVAFRISTSTRFRIAVPDVAPGFYRITNWVEYTGQTRWGRAIIEVVESG